MSLHKGVETTGQPSPYLTAKAKIPSPKQEEEKTSKTFNTSGAVVTDFEIEIILFQHTYFYIVLLLSFFIKMLSLHPLYVLTANEHK